MSKVEKYATSLAAGIDGTRSFGDFFQWGWKIAGCGSGGRGVRCMRRSWTEVDTARQTVSK